MRFDTMISFQAKSRPTAPAIVTMERVVTYAMLEAGIASVEARLIAAGVKAGGTAGILVANPLRHIALIIALYRQGVVSVSLPSPAEAAIPELGLTALLAEPGGAIAAPAWAIQVTDDWFDGAAEPATRPPPFGDDEPYRIALSSGTTGRPKPMWITPARTERHLPLYLGALASTGWQRIMCTLGLTTGWGYHAALTALQYGKTYVCASSPHTTLETISLFQVDCLIASMHQARALVEAQQEFGIPTPSLRSLYIGGSAASRNFFSEMQQFCANVTSCYGSTEMGAVAMAPINRLPDISGAIGYVLPWLEVEAVDGDDKPLPAGSEGVLRMRTAHQAYFDGPPRSDASSDLPWFYPGDRGSVQADGLMSVTGRVSELINVGGVKIAPESIEQVLKTHRAIGDCAVAGVRNERGMEEVQAIVMLRESIGDADLVAWCAAKFPSTPVTRVVFVESVPRNAAGKIVRGDVVRLLAVADLSQAGTT